MWWNLKLKTLKHFSCSEQTDWIKAEPIRAGVTAPHHRGRHRFHVVDVVVVVSSSAFLLMSPWCVQGLRVDLSPRSPLFQLGGRGQLACRVQDCPTTPSVSWSVLEDRPLTAAISSNSTGSVVTFDPVMLEHEGMLVCRASCGAETRQTRTSLRVYGESQGHMMGGGKQEVLRS